MEYLTNNWQMILEQALMVLGGLTVVTMGVAKITTQFKGDDKVAKVLRKMYNFGSKYVNAPLKLPEPEDKPSE